MMYIENIFLCMVAPILVAMLCVRGRSRWLLFAVAMGMCCCLLSAYISSFLAGYYGADAVSASIEIAPVVEEIMKALPLVFLLIIYEPKAEDIITVMLLVAIGFATFENVCYLVDGGAARLSYLLVRGFSTGAMHVVCGVLLGVGLATMWRRASSRYLGVLGLLCMAITFHATYNLVVSAEGLVEYIGFAMPIATLLIVLAIRKFLFPRFVTTLS